MTAIRPLAHARRHARAARRSGLHRFALAAATALTVGCAAGGPARQAAAPAGPRAAGGPDAARQVVAERGLVTSASPYASEAGVEMLRRGGNAVDAAVATAFALGVVEPQMSGLGGGGGMLVWLEAEGRAEYVDFYASKPAAPYRDLPEPDSTTPLRVVAVPGEVAGLLEAHGRFGRLSRAEVMAPAIRLAEEGVPVNQILARMIARDSAKLHRWDEARRLLWPDGRPLGPGETLRQPELAATLRIVADRGRDGFYRGPVARDVVRLLNQGGNPIAADEFGGFQPRWKRPLCGDFRGLAVLSAPPPQTGHQIIHTLNLLEAHDLAALGLPTRSAEAFDVLTSALRAGMAANRHNDDPRWETVPAAGLTSNAFAEARAGLVGVGRVPEEIDEGEPLEYDDEPPPAACEPFDPYGPATVASGRSTAGEAVGGHGTAAAPRARAGREASMPGPAADVLDGGRRAATGAAGRRGGRVPGEAAEPADGGRRAAMGGEGGAARGRAVGNGGTGAEEAGGETTHLSVVDVDGNAVALTRTNSSLFGSGARVRGFFLNNSGFDFSDDAEDAEGPEGAEAGPDAAHGAAAGGPDPNAAAPAPEWRTRRSTISPTIVLDGGDVRMVVGAPGGGRIPTAIVQTMVYDLEYGLDPLRAIRMPRIFPTPSGRRVQLEGGFSADMLAAARAMGYEPAALSFGYARLYMIARDGDRWIGAADPRHDGEPRGH